MAGLRGRQVQCLTRDGDGRIWVGTEAEIAVFDGGRFQTMTPTNGESRLDVSMLRFSRDGGLWVVANGRARKARGRTWIWTDDAGARPDRPVPPVGQLPRGSPRRRLADALRQGRAARPAATAAPAASPAPTGCRARASATCSRIAKATSGWPSSAPASSASATRGSRRCPRTARATTAVASVADDRDGAMWIGSMGDGLQRYRDGALTQLPGARRVGGRVRLLGRSRTPTGRIWLSADREDLFYFDGHRIRPSPVHVHGVKTLLADRDGGLWVGTKTGVARIADGRLHVFGPERRLRTPRRARAGAGTGRRRVDRLGRRHDLSLPRRPAARVPSAGCAGVARRSGRCTSTPTASLWIGTFRGGLLRLRDGRFDALHHRPTACRATSSARSSRTSRGQLWIGSLPGHLPRQQGVARCAPRRARSTSSATADRTACRRSSARATISRPAATSRDGRLWFATPKGVVSIDPRDAGDRPGRRRT